MKIKKGLGDLCKKDGNGFFLNWMKFDLCDFNLGGGALPVTSDLR